MQEVDLFKAIANERRLQILDWLKDPQAHFPAQADGDLVEDGVCALLIAEKLGITQATLPAVAPPLRRDEDRIADTRMLIQNRL
ncbi:ArsR family transcriptional regulator [Mesorhizobium sp. LSJC277A00]|nr:ArsR family transcriptional regulator [Mesorhizobium sp. LSJC277A00]ESW63866.1 ArsR family transcriptional regulator [Mesorhizobium sp. LSJC277A00]